jgi:HSP20 family protein
MAIIRWNPFSIDRLIEDEWDIPTIPGITRLVGQGLNLYETDTGVVVEAALPGIPEDSVDISIDDDVLRITGSANTSQEDRDKRKYYMSSMTESYNYSLRLPKGINTGEEPQCEMQNGLLKITFPKTTKQAPKKIKIGQNKADQQQGQQSQQQQLSGQQQPQQQQGQQSGGQSSQQQSDDKL